MDLKFDVKAFHHYVETQVASLAAHGIICSELVTNLFTAYFAVKDDEFLQFVRLHYFQYEQSPNVTNATTLMASVENHYYRRLAENSWHPTISKSDKEKIIALETTIAEMKADKDKEKPKERSNKRDRDNEGKWAWKRIAPKQGKPSTFVRGNKTYHWCHKHRMWTIHTPEECTLKQPLPEVNSTTEEKKETTKENKESKKDKVQMDQAYQTIINSGGRVFA
jgi:hypothetical protein